MRPDHYATLGVEPDANPAEIRAAYLKLLREYHPDRNRSPEAAQRTQAIIAAFKLLSDFDQRSYYDWDRRRDREAAEAAAEKAPRRVRRAGLAAGGIGLAAVGAWLLMPGPTTERMATAPRIAAADPRAMSSPRATPVRAAAARPVAAPKERRVIVIRMRPELPKAPQAKVATQKAARPVAKETPKPVVRVAASKPVPKRESAAPKPPPLRVAATLAPPVRVAATPAPRVKVAARPAPTAPKAAQSPARPTTDLASLDQFVMNFYGQSWRYGDAPKRAVLEQSRASFVARRGACTGDTCRRNAYLDLMRDVSSIVETGKPEPR